MVLGAIAAHRMGWALNRSRFALLQQAMSKPILVGYDPRALDHAPVDFGVEAAKLTGAKLVVVLVERAGSPVLPVSGHPVDYAIGQVDGDLVDDCSAALQQIYDELRALGIPFDCLKREHTSAARA